MKKDPVRVIHPLLISEAITEFNKDVSHLVAVADMLSDTALSGINEASAKALKDALSKVQRHYA